MTRTRFAPSPTGFMHVGNFRTGLFAWLTARSTNGTFILRLEDTDKNREVQGSAEHIVECFNVLGLSRDEGFDVGGEFGPYRQSDRLEIYRKWAQILIDSGRAYADPYTADEVQAFREQAQKEKRAFLYRHHRPESPPVWDGTTPLRFKSDPKPYQWHDEVMGDLSTGPEVIDDFILIKSDGYPTYNFAHIIDDAEMRITHVIRGQEFISSVPNYLNLYDALKLTPPIMATMPHIMNEHGNKKLGKRDGAKDVLDYVRQGYLPDALISFIATLGWNDGSEQEVFTREELINKFSLSRVQKSGARFDERRLLWVNGQVIRSLSLDDLYTRVDSFWPAEADRSSEAYKKQVLRLAQERLKTLADLPTLTRYFFAEPAQDWTLISDNKQLKKLSHDERKHLLMVSQTALSACEWSPDAIQTTLNALLETTGEKPGTLFSLIRVVTTWAPFSPPLNETLYLLGRKNVLHRIQQALNAA